MQLSQRPGARRSGQPMRDGSRAKGMRMPVVSWSSRTARGCPWPRGREQNTVGPLSASSRAPRPSGPNGPRGRAEPAAFAAPAPRNDRRPRAHARGQTDGHGPRVPTHHPTRLDDAAHSPPRTRARGEHSGAQVDRPADVDQTSGLGRTRVGRRAGRGEERVPSGAGVRGGSPGGPEGFRNARASPRDAKHTSVAILRLIASSSRCSTTRTSGGTSRQHRRVRQAPSSPTRLAA